MDDWEDDRLVRKVSRVVILLIMLMMLREAIIQKIPKFYEIISQTGRGVQSDFISLIQK